jgi:hypothetical protein
MGIAAALALVAGCKEPTSKKTIAAPDAPPAARPPDAAPPPPAGPLVLEPAKEYTLPPVEAGWQRIDALDVDLKVGACEPGVSGRSPRIWGFGFGAAKDATPARTEELPDGTVKVFEAQGRSEVQVDRKVANLAIECRGFAEGPDEVACLIDACKSVRAVPGGSAEEVWPDGEPVIWTATSGGIVDLDRGGAGIYADGTVQFFGPKCKRWRGRRGALDAAALGRLLDEIDQGGAFAKDGTVGAPVSDCSDDVYTNIFVKGEHRIRTGCGPNPAGLEAADARISEALGPNPCG